MAANLAMTGILENMMGKDKDYRYMATSDLLNELNKDSFKLDSDLEVMSTEIKCECLDILCDVLHKFGNLMVADHDLLLVALLSQVNSNQASVRKKIVACIDHYDVKMPCHLILLKLADKCPSAVLAVLDSLVDPLQKPINFKPKLDAIKQEVDRNEDMIRSALRAIASLSRISGGDCSLEFKNLMAEISISPALWKKYYSIRNE